MMDICDGMQSLYIGGTVISSFTYAVIAVLYASRKFGRSVFIGTMVSILLLISLLEIITLVIIDQWGHFLMGFVGACIGLAFWFALFLCGMIFISTLPPTFCFTLIGALVSVPLTGWGIWMIALSTINTTTHLYSELVICEPITFFILAAFTTLLVHRDPIRDIDRIVANEVNDANDANPQYDEMCFNRLRLVNAEIMYHVIIWSCVCACVAGLSLASVRFCFTAFPWLFYKATRTLALLGFVTLLQFLTDQRRGLVPRQQSDCQYRLTWLQVALPRQRHLSLLPFLDTLEPQSR